MSNFKEKQFDIPAWLLKDEVYNPELDRDTFINKSILALLSVLSRIKAQGYIEQSRYSVNAVFKVMFTFILVLMLSISRSFAFIIIVNVYLLAVLSLMDVINIVKILRISFMMAIFTFIILLPATFWGNGYGNLMITLKVYGTITAVNILSHSTRWSSIISTLKCFFIPDIFILVLDITIKYIVMLGDFSLNMLYALKLRSVGKNKSKYTSVSGIAGTMFIKSKEMAEDMYAAMECRGFSGEYKSYSILKFNIADAIYIIVNIIIVLIFIYFGRI